MIQSKDLFKVSTVQEAMAKLKEYFLPFFERTEEISLERSWGRIVADDIIAVCDLPHFRKSTVDGLAVRAADTFGASETQPALLQCKGEIRMGEKPVNMLANGEAMLIPTGAMLPANSDAVVMIEQVEDYGDSLYGVSKAVAPGENVINIGEDISRGKLLLPKYSRIRAQEMGLLAAQGILSVPVLKRFRIGILSTGDEIVPPSVNPDLAQTRDINGYSLLGQAMACGCEAQYYGIVKDSKNELLQKMKLMLEENDIVILSGGSSVGNRDLVAGLIAEIGKPGILFHGLALKPGKPTLAGAAEGKLIFGLPGHPASAMVVFDTIIRPWLDFSWQRPDDLPFPEGILTQNVYSGSGREEFVPVQIIPNGEEWLLEPVRGKSGLISTMTKADGWVHISLNEEGIQAGQRLKVRLLR